MAPRVRLRPHRLLPPLPPPTPYICQQCRHASLATAAVATPTTTMISPPVIARHPPTQPPSYKRPEFRKSQLHRQYQSLLRSTPLMVLFQHNNLKATEWMGIRRELAFALEAADNEAASSRHTDPSIPPPPRLAPLAKLHTVQTGIFASALQIVELWPLSPENPSSSPPDTLTNTPPQPHGLSKQAYKLAKSNHQLLTGLEPLLSGPLALFTLPTVSPAHLAAALSILSPGKDFPAPKRRSRPGYFDPAVQNGLQKMLMLAARVEGRVFDIDGVRWVGGIDKGIDGLRAQLVGMLQSVGAGVTGTLEAASRSLYFTMEGRKGMLEDQKGGSDGQ